ncbi:MAG: aminotransferase class V-fold PLP-dependent enzyme [Pseudomonadota bacterium]
MNFNPLVFKQQFPLFDQQENQSLVYLDNAATTQKPQCVIDAISDFYIKSNANAHRSGYRLAQKATNIVESVRKKVAYFINSQQTESIVFTSGATESLNIIANGFKGKLQADDEILITIAEHHANLVPWQVLAKSESANLVFAESYNDLLEKITKATKVVAISAAGNILGERIPDGFIKAIKRRAPDVSVAVDASQLVAHQKIDVNAMGCDFLACSAHKFYGPSGIGILYGRRDLLDHWPPLQFGGEMVKTVDLHSCEYHHSPMRLETGTAPLSAIAGLGACIDFVCKYPRQAIRDYEQGLIELLHNCLDQLRQKYPAITVLTSAKNNVGIAALSVKKPYSIYDLGFWLDENDIAVRVGHHCAQPLWNTKNLDGGLRISLAAYNTEDDINRLIDSIDNFFQHISVNFLTENKSFDQGIFNDDFSKCAYQSLIRIKPWQRRYQQIIEWGKCISFKSAIREQQYSIKACESSLWLAVKQQNERYFFAADSDSAIVKGLLALILCRVQGEHIEAIERIDFKQYFAALQLDKHLSVSRINGLNAVVNTINKIVGH